MHAVAVSAYIREKQLHEWSFQKTSEVEVKCGQELKAISEQNPNAGDQVLYMCNYCNPLIKKNVLPPRCILNGLHVVPIPEELAQLDCLSTYSADSAYKVLPDCGKAWHVHR